MLGDENQLHHTMTMTMTLVCSCSHANLLNFRCSLLQFKLISRVCIENLKYEWNCITELWFLRTNICYERIAFHQTGLVLLSTIDNNCVRSYSFVKIFYALPFSVTKLKNVRPIYKLITGTLLASVLIGIVPSIKMLKTLCLSVFFSRCRHVRLTQK